MRLYFFVFVLNSLIFSALTIQIQNLHDATKLMKESRNVTEQKTRNEQQFSVTTLEERITKSKNLMNGYRRMLWSVPVFIIIFLHIAMFITLIVTLVRNSCRSDGIGLFFNHTFDADQRQQLDLIHDHLFSTTKPRVTRQELLTSVIQSVQKQRDRNASKKSKPTKKDKTRLSKKLCTDKSQTTFSVKPGNNEGVNSVTPSDFDAIDPAMFASRKETPLNTPIQARTPETDLSGRISEMLDPKNIKDPKLVANEILEKAYADIDAFLFNRNKKVPINTVPLAEVQKSKKQKSRSKKKNKSRKSKRRSVEEEKDRKLTEKTQESSNIPTQEANVTPKSKKKEKTKSTKTSTSSPPKSTVKNSPIQQSTVESSVNKIKSLPKMDKTLEVDEKSNGTEDVKTKKTLATKDTIDKSVELNHKQIEALSKKQKENTKEATEEKMTQERTKDE